MDVNDYKKLISKTKKKSKHNNQKVDYDGITFDSGKEKDYYVRLKLLERMGEVKYIEVHKRYDFYINDIYIGFYKLDFKVEYTDGVTEHIDVKGIDKKTGKKVTSTSTFMLKKKLMKAIHGIDVLIR